MLTIRPSGLQTNPSIVVLLRRAASEKRRIAFMVKVKDMMAKSVFTITKKNKIKETADLMKKNGVGSLLVKEENQYLGIITETDIVHKVVAQGLSPQITTVDSVMSFPLISIEANAEIEEAGRQMIENGIRHLAVTQDGQIIGMVSMRDLIRLMFNSEEPLES